MSGDEDQRRDRSEGPSAKQKDGKARDRIKGRERSERLERDRAIEVVDRLDRALRDRFR
ncbi:hypothetical protein MKK75_03775 [Methylobacterium sp. J-030]|uniref:hypothetical protein n=1 Tax=Methylobacterium sp. J-030 TaxID=2836627 RepID=UPI001FBA3420|nr:hypothetical protein [Methylobacterium sp. J-030]MCJ2067934.1 hypothetical protein [Methylobacterium sp. J-030]